MGRIVSEGGGDQLSPAFELILNMLSLFDGED